ncbi:MAG: alpha/beta hydrolase [bacterium]
MLDATPTPLAYEVVETAPNPSRAVIWLHGLGADGFDFLPIVSQLGLPEQADIRFIFPHAPMRAVTINGGYPMRAWYDITALDATSARQANHDEIMQSMRGIHHLIEQQRNAGIALDKIVLAGFSQGGVIALHTALTYPQRLAGVMALSTYFPNIELCLEAPPEYYTQLPIFSAHGVEDDVLPHELATHYRQLIKETDLTIRDYQMAHALCDDEIQDLGRWLVFTLF